MSKTIHEHTTFTREVVPLKKMAEMSNVMVITETLLSGNVIRVTSSGQLSKDAIEQVIASWQRMLAEGEKDL